MKRTPLFLSLLAVALSATVQAQTLINGSFEIPALTPGGWQYMPDLGTWKDSPTAGVANGNSPWGRGGVNSNQYGFLQRNSWINQPVTDLTPGKLYAGTFWAMRRNGGFGADNGIPLKVTVDGVLAFPLTFYDQPTWKKFPLWPFQATTNTGLLEFVALPEFEDRTELIDEVKIFEVGPSVVASLVATAGLYAGGQPTDTSASDDVYWNLRPEPGGDNLTDPIKLSSVFVVAGTPSYLCVTVESAVSTSSLNQLVKLFNVRTGVWDTVSDQQLASTDLVKRSAIVENPTDYVDPLSHNVRCEVWIRKRMALPSNLWRYRVDQIQLVWAP